MTSGAEVTIVPSCACISPCCGEAAPARASPATPASGRLGSGSRIRSRAWTLRGPRPGTGSGPGQCEWPPAAAHPTVRASARGAPGHHPALGAANKPAARRAPSATSPTFHTLAWTVAPPRRRGGRSAHRHLSLKGGDTPLRGHAPATAQSPSTARQCGAWRHPARRPAAHRPAPSDRARDRPAHGPSTPPGDRPPNRLLARPHQATRRAASRRTTSRFRLALHRCPGAKAPAPTAAPSAPTPLALRAPSVRADPAPCTLLD